MPQRATNPAMPALSALQVEVAQSLAADMPVVHAAARHGVDRRTVQRWAKHNDAFAQEVADRRALAAAADRIDEAKRITPTGFNLTAALADLREAKKATRLTVRNAGNSILEKCVERLADIPAEAVPIKDLPQFFRVGKELLEWSDAQESEELELDQLLEHLISPESLATQRVTLETEANISQIFQAIYDSPEFSGEEKQRIFQTIGGQHVRGTTANLSANS